jgi:hypothetical protein
MMDNYEENNFRPGRSDRDEIFGKAIKAGKRTYFIDVKSTRKNDYFITLTESSKRFNEDGSQFYQKHKIFLYKEDFEAFVDGLTEAMKKVIELTKASEDELGNKITGGFSDINFEDLGRRTEEDFE